MPNLFVRTRYRLTEEDRLTNALLSVLELCDRRAFAGFLTLLDVPVERTQSAGGDAWFELQVAFDRSRPDARIRIGDLDIVIESKLGTALDEAQFRHHWQAIALASGRETILVGLTGALSDPPIVAQL